MILVDNRYSKFCNCMCIFYITECIFIRSMHSNDVADSEYMYVYTYMCGHVHEHIYYMYALYIHILHICIIHTHL